MKKIISLLCVGLLSSAVFAEGQPQGNQVPLSQEQQLAVNHFLSHVQLERTTPVSSSSNVVVLRVSDDTVCKIKVRQQKLKSAAAGEQPQVQLVVDGTTQCMQETKKETQKPVKIKK